MLGIADEFPPELVAHSLFLGMKLGKLAFLRT